MSDIPSHLPILRIPPDQLGRGWRAVGIGEQIRSGDQLWAVFVAPSRWVTSSFTTSDGYRNAGKQTYRRAVSLRARLSTLLPVLTKHWRRLFVARSEHSAS